MAAEETPTAGTGYLRFLSFGGWIYAAVTGTSTLFQIVTTFTRDVVELRMPVTPFWPQLYPTVELDPAPAATVVGGGFMWADVAIEGLGTDARILQAGGLLTQGAVGVIIGIAIAVLCRRLLADDPFRPAVSRAAALSGASVLIGGLAWQVFYQAAGTIASRSVLSLTGWSYNNEILTDEYLGGRMNDIGWPQPVNGWTLDFWPIWIGLALLAVAAVFRRGERLRQQAEELERDTAGLV